MSISKEIGWGTKENLLHNIYKKLKRANGLGYKLTQGNFNQPVCNVAYTIDSVVEA